MSAFLFKVAKVLFEAGLKDNKHSDGYWGFHRACWGREKRHAKTVKVFLDNGTDPEFKSDDGRTCMQMTTNKHTKKVLRKHAKNHTEL